MTAGTLKRAAIAIVLLLWPMAAAAQSVNIDLGAAGQAGATGRLVQLTALITVLSVAPSLLVMATAFTRIVIVLSLLRSALGTQGTPPNLVLIGLALFLSFFVMQPVLERSWDEGIAPLIAGQVAELDGLQRAAEPVRGFMAAQTRPDDLRLFLELGHLAPSDQNTKQEVAQPRENMTMVALPPWRALMPAFLVSELRRAFEIGFLIYLPFLVIDLLVASLLMSLGMMMLPPTAVSLPFKLIFFVLVDGWRLVAGSLAQSFN